MPYPDTIREHVYSDLFHIIYTDYYYSYAYGEWNHYVPKTFYNRALVYEIFRALYLEYLNSQQFVGYKNYAKVDIIVLRRKVPIEDLKNMQVLSYKYLESRNCLRFI